MRFHIGDLMSNEQSQLTRSREQGAEIREQGAGSWEQGAESREKRDVGHYV